MSSNIDSLKNAALGTSEAKYWEKKLNDMNNVDETFANARDLGYTRLNYSRLTAIGKLAAVDKVDIYKTNVVSNRGKLAISLRTATEDDKVLDLSKYESYLDSLKQQMDPEGYAKEQEEKRAKEANQKSLDITAPGMRLEVYSTNKQGKQVLIADSTAEEGSKERVALEQMLVGEYEASKGQYYIKVSREDGSAAKTEKDETPYAMQIQMGSSYKHDYVAMEQISEESKSGKEVKIPLSSSDSSGNLSAVNALQIQASRYQATAQMLQVGYMNMADIYSKYSKY